MDLSVGTRIEGGSKNLVPQSIKILDNLDLIKFRYVSLCCSVISSIQTRVDTPERLRRHLV